jgi:hypothetical protein
MHPVEKNTADLSADGSEAQGGSRAMETELDGVKGEMKTAPELTNGMDGFRAPIGAARRQIALQNGARAQGFADAAPKPGAPLRPARRSAVFPGATDGSDGMLEPGILSGGPGLQRRQSTERRKHASPKTC